MRRTPQRAVSSLLPLVALAGCNSHPELVKVTGVVQLDGSQPPGPGSVYFAPIEDATGTGARPAFADFDVDGKFAIRAFGDAYGMKPGRYRVTVQIWKERPQGYLNPGVNVVPSGYMIDDLVVEAGQSNVEVLYDIKTKSG